MQITFDDLNQEFKDFITAVCEGIYDKKEDFEVLQCRMSRCIVKSNEIIGIFSNDSGKFNSVWLNNEDVNLIYGSVTNMWKKGGSAKTEAKANASRENGKLGGRPRKKKEE